MFSCFSVEAKPWYTRTCLVLILPVRLVDWGAYVLLVNWFDMPYTPTIVAIRIALFGLKFFGYLKVFEEPESALELTANEAGEE